MGRIPEDGVFVGPDERGPGLMARLREAGELRRTARAERKAQKASERPEPEDVYGRAERRVRPVALVRTFYRVAAPWVVCFLVAAVFLGSQRMAALEAQIAAQTSRSAPTGFAELCVGMFLSAGGEESASTERFLSQCKPGVSPELLADQVPGGLLGAQIAAIEGKTFVDPDVPQITSVLVGVRSQVRQEAQAPGEEVRADEGLVYYRVAVAENDRGDASLVGLPVMTSEPVTDDPPTLAGAFRVANPDDPRVDAAQRYIAGALMSARVEGRDQGEDAGEGRSTGGRVAGPEQVLSPGVPFSVLESDLVTGVQVTHAAIEERGGQTYVVAAARVEYGESAAVVLTYSFQMVRVGERWEIAEVRGSPKVTAVDGRPVISQSESR